MKEIINIIKREIRKVVSDRNLMMIFLFAPLAYPFLYGAIYMNKAEENVPIAVQDFDNSSLSRALIRDIDAHQNIVVVKNLADEQINIEEMRNESFQAILQIPKDFSKNFKYGKKVNLKLMISTGRLVVLGDIGSPISQIASTFGGKATASFLMKKGVPVLQESGYAQGIKINFQYMYNPYMTYGDLMLPGLIIILLSQLVFIGVAASQAKEYLLDNWNDQFLISKNPLLIAIGKLSVYITTFIVIAIIYFLIIAPFYDISYNSSMLNLMIISFFGIAASASLGLFIGTFFKHRISVFVVLGFTTYPFFMVSGYAWPIEQLPEWIALISKCFPLTPFLMSILNVSQMENTMSLATNNLEISALQTIVYSSLFIIRLFQLKRKNTNNSMRLF